MKLRIVQLPTGEYEVQKLYEDRYGFTYWVYYYFKEP
nr:MAG TPA: hypothetical protein [Caudoviricetes sp.]